MVSDWSFRNGKFPQVFMTLLSSLADLKNTEVGVVSTCPLISKFSSPFFYSFWEISRSNTYNWYYSHLHDPYLKKNSHTRSRGISLFSLF